MSNKTIDTLVDDIYILLASGKADEYLTIVLDTLHRAAENRNKKNGTLRASNIGVPCDRKLWYNLQPDIEPEPLEPHVFMKFLTGDVIEAAVLELAKIAGHTVEREQDTVEVAGIRGHIDAIIDGVLIDVKSASPYAFENKFVKRGLLKDDPFGYLHQLALYKKATGVERQGLLVVHKVLGHIHFMEVFDDELPDVEQRIENLRFVETMQEPPERGFFDEPYGKSGNMVLGVNCSYCEYKHHCWPGLRTFIGSRGPVFFTKIIREPKMTEVTKNEKR